MNCLICKKKNVSITDIRGQKDYEDRLQQLLFQENEETPKFGPLHCCLECLSHMLNLELKGPGTLSIPNLLRNTDSESLQGQQGRILNPQSLPSPDSSGHQLILGDSSSSSSDSSAATIPPSSESIVALATAALPIASTQNSSGLGSQPVSEDILMGPPDDPRLLSKYQDIMMKPGPMSIKRRKLLHLHNNNTPTDITNLQPNPAVSDVNDIYQMLLKDAPEQIRRHREKRRLARSQRSSSSSQNSSSSSSQDLRNISSNEPIGPMPPPAAMSPFSSQLVSQSPSTIISNDRRRLPSSSLSSSEELLTRSLRNELRTNDSNKNQPAAVKPVTNPVRQPTAVVTNRPGPTTRRSATPQLSSSPDLPTPATIAPKITDDGNAHSNSGAPRRINYTRPNTGVTGRDIRLPNSRLLIGG